MLVVFPASQVGPQLVSDCSNRTGWGSRKSKLKCVAFDPPRDGSLVTLGPMLGAGLLPGSWSHDAPNGAALIY